MAENETEVQSTGPAAGDTHAEEPFVGVSPEYQNYANDTEAPLPAEAGPEADLEERFVTHTMTLDEQGKVVGDLGLPEDEAAAREQAAKDVQQARKNTVAARERALKHQEALAKGDLMPGEDTSAFSTGAPRSLSQSRQELDEMREQAGISKSKATTTPKPKADESSKSE